MNRHLLLILDGYGIAEDATVSAMTHAKKPFLDKLFASYPHATLEASGLAVGLPDGQMGNSEVGHMNLGAGRVVYQDITRIDKAIRERVFYQNTVLRAAAAHAKANDGKLHLFGLFSDGGVHASFDHLFALLQLAKDEGLAADQVCVHAFTDGRDTDPHGAIGYVKQFQERAAEIGVGRLASIVGRYYAMDRDKRWSRTGLAYRLLTKGQGETFTDPLAAVQASYDAGVTDEFIKPCAITYAEGRSGLVEDGDAIIFYNFRADRARQLTWAFTRADFADWIRAENAKADVPESDEEKAPFVVQSFQNLHYVTFTPYHKAFVCPIAFPKVDLTDTIGEVVARSGGTQLRAAETEKYPHVTFFFSGGREEPFEGEDRVLVASPKVPTYDLQPEMSAPELAEKVATALGTETYNFVVLNFANPDMVGHTGVFEAAVQAIEAVDAGTQQVVDAAQAHGYSITIIADHGNADRMRNPDGSPHTAHTTVPVPHLIIKEGFAGPIRDGKLGDIAPTILDMLGIDIPATMDGDVLI